MVGILISLLVALIVVSIVYWIVSMLPFPAPFKQIAMAVCALILLCWILGIVGVWGPGWRVR